jgi:uncharacterized membrane protein (DUF2068 family)
MRRHRRLSYELLDCGWHGHVLVGTDAAAVRPGDDLVARELDGLRWYRCLRCDSWLPRALPAAPTRPFPPGRDEITLPLRGRPLRDRYVLRLIALDRSVHFVVLAVLAAAVFVFIVNKSAWQQDFLRIVTALQGSVGGPVNTSSGGIEGELTKLFAFSTRNLELTGVALAAYAALEGVEAVGLWRGKRWAEYLTFLATVLLVPLEVYEIAGKPTVLKCLTLAINVAIVVYLMLAKRLFGLRGGERAQRAVRETDEGWAALERATPRPVAPSPTPPPPPPTGPAAEGSTQARSG